MKRRTWQDWLLIALCDLYWLFLRGDWVLWREVARNPGAALELMARDHVSWKVLIDPIPPSFSPPAVFGRPAPIRAHGAEWWVYVRNDTIGDASKWRIARELREQRRRRRSASPQNSRAV